MADGNLHVLTLGPDLNPLRNVPVAILGPAGRTRQRTRADGLARFDAIAEGDYQVATEATATHQPPQFLQVEGAESVLATEPVSVVAGETTVVVARYAPATDGTREASEALVDASTYPLMTESVSTAGGPAPGAGATGTGAQAVEQVVRDILGWRPKADDPKAFQAALAGAFDLKEVEGHVEYTWRPRGYAVQADMGAVTGAQASIYARARAALEQALPLLDGLTPLDPAADPQDTAAIRGIVRGELVELVDELGMRGGPRVQRVDELFDLLLGGDRHGRLDRDPERAGGQLGLLAERFGLVRGRVNTVEEERVLTNYLIVVDYANDLRSSWNNVRGGFTGTGRRPPFLGNQLILLGRTLEVVAESLDEVEFALDSVFVGQAERQALQLRLDHEPPIFLGDLLEWVRRVATQEGPRLLQDAGRDGVVAFRPVVERLQRLVHATVELSRHRPASIPAGFGTPRVRRSLEELDQQIEQAVALATRVGPRPAPVITYVLDPTLLGAVQARVGGLSFFVLGSGIQRGATARLVPDLAGVDHHNGQVSNVSDAGTFCLVEFADRPNNRGSRWSLELINPDDGRSNEFLVLTVP